MFKSEQEQLMFQSIATLIESLMPKFDERKERDLPTATQLNSCLSAVNSNNKTLQFMSQDESLPFDDLGYEQRIYLHGIIATRNNSWHDFFNALAWLHFPKLKSALNQIHYQEQSKQRGTQRSKRRDLLTLFDECGVIIQADENIRTMIKKHQWQALFVGNRNLWLNGEIRIITFGHAMHEKYLNPYIGMTAKVLFLPIDVIDCDALAASNVLKNELLVNKGELFPLPVLGIPGWHENQDDEFYANRNYFRS